MDKIIQLNIAADNIRIPSAAMVEKAQSGHPDSILPVGKKIFGLTAGLSVILEWLVGCNARILIFWTAIAISGTLPAQTPAKDRPIGGLLQFKNVHLWRGQEVTDEATFATDIYYTNKKQNLRIGLWGGAGMSGKFKEIDYYVSYKLKGFTFALWDIYNFSPEADYNNRQVFNYNARKTGHFIDLSITCRFQQKIPLKIYWATILFGRDRGILNDKNRYSTFVELSYPVVRNNIVNLDFGIAGAFALNKGNNVRGNKTESHFYGDSPGIVSVNFIIFKTLDLWGYKLPISVTPVWNPEKNYANIQLALNFISL
ncbi:MAG: hypothetical protein LBG96_13085 [Tannerella sp.]|jgi:hypothetical protein|nr:hypothetical protein [Tannerella sp.]